MSDWTEERVAQLTKLWGDGYSASQIARILGGITRCSVIGKVHRLSLPLRSQDARHKHRPAPQAKRAPAIVELQPPPEPEAPIVLEDGSHITIMQLTHGTCRWPIGDPQDGDFHFCGHPVLAHSPYCDAHRIRAYQPMPKRRTKIARATDREHAVTTGRTRIFGM